MVWRTENLHIMMLTRDKLPQWRLWQVRKIWPILNTIAILMNNSTQIHHIPLERWWVDIEKKKNLFSTYIFFFAFFKWWTYIMTMTRNSQLKYLFSNKLFLILNLMLNLVRSMVNLVVFTNVKIKLNKLFKVHVNEKS